MTWYEVRMFLIKFENLTIYNSSTSNTEFDFEDYILDLYIIVIENKTNRYKYNAYCAIRISFRNFFRV